MQLPTPYLLTAFHAIASFAGSSILRSLTDHTPAELPPLSLVHHITLGALSFLYTINIAISNLSLSLVSLPLHQTIRAVNPAITVFVSHLITPFPPAYSAQTYCSLIPIILGVFLATYDHGHFSASSPHDVLLTFSGAFLATFKTVTMHRLQTTHRAPLSPLQLIHYLSPWAALQSGALAWWTGEIGIFQGQFALPNSLTARSTVAVYLLCNCTGAFLLNVASFEANQRSGPLSIAVASNLKQVVILLTSLRMGSGSNPHIIYRSHVIGSLMTVFGGIWYAKSENRRPLKAKNVQSAA